VSYTEVNVPARTLLVTPGRINAWLTNLPGQGARARFGRWLLYALIALLPVHAGLVSVGYPSWWKEVVVWAALLVSLTLPARARLDRLDFLVVAYFAIVIVSAVVHRVTNFADLSPYFVYVPLAIIVPRVLVTSNDVAILVEVAIGALLLNAAWMGTAHVGIINVPNLLLVDGPHWNSTGSLTGDALTTATLYGVAAGVAWVGAAVSRRHVTNALLGLALTAAGAMTGSRAALVASALGLFIALTLTAARLRSERFIGPLLIFGCVCFAIAAIVVGQHALKANDPIRVSRWEATIQLAIHNPLLGAGPGATGQARVERELGLAPNSTLSDNLVGTRVSESSVLKVAAEVGFPAFLLISAWLLLVLIRAGVLRPISLYGRPYDFVGPALVILTIVNGLTVQNMESFVGATLFWLGIGLCRARWTAAEHDSIQVPALADLGWMSLLDRTRRRILKPSSTP
jgi:hypothetical protein